MDVGQKILQNLLERLPLMLFGVFGIVFMLWILLRNKPKVPPNEKRERSEPVSCPYCGCRESPNGRLRPFYTCFECGRHFTVNRELTAEEQATVREEDEECARLRTSLPDPALYREILDAVFSHSGWVNATVWPSMGTVTADLLVRKESDDPLRGSAYVSESIAPIPVPYPLKSAAARLVFIGDLKAFVDREYGYCMDTGYNDTHRALTLSIRR